MILRGKKKSQIIVSLEDLTQSEELKILKKKAKLADQQLYIFFEYFKQQISQYFHDIDASTVTIDEPVKQLLHAKRKAAKLFNTVQNIAAFRKQDNQDGGGCDIQQFQNRQRLKSFNMDKLQNFNFCTLIDEIKTIFPNLKNQKNIESSNLFYLQNLDEQTNMHNDINRIKCIFITLLSQLEECLPENNFKDIVITYDIKQETHFEAIQVYITIPVHLDCIQNQQIQFNSSFNKSGFYVSNSINTIGGQQLKNDGYNNLKSLLNYYKQDNIEIRNIEIAMLKFYLAQLSPNEMYINEAEELEIQKTQTPSNSELNNQDTSQNYENKIDDRLDEDFEINTQKFNTNRKDDNQNQILQDLDSCQRSFKLDQKEEQDFIDKTKKKNSEKKQTNQQRFIKRKLDKQDGLKKIRIQISFFKDIRVILGQKEFRSQTVYSNNQNVLDLPLTNNDSKTYVPLSPNLTREPSQKTSCIELIPLSSVQQTYSTKRKSKNLNSPKQFIKDKLKQNQFNSDLFQPYSLSPQCLSSQCETSILEKNIYQSTYSIPKFFSKTLTKLNSFPKNNKNFKLTIKEQTLQTKQSLPNLNIQDILANNSTNEL